MNVTFLTFNLSRLAGGLFYSVSNLARSLNNGVRNHRISILGMHDEFSIEDRYQYDGCNVEYYNILPLFKRYGISFTMYKKLKELQPEIVHQHGIWMFNSAVLSYYKAKNSCIKIIISPRGMMDPWILKRSRLLKKLVCLFWEKRNWNNCACFHALCDSEYKSIRRICKKTPIAIIPNGISIPDWNRDYSLKVEKKKIIFISRIHEKKGVKELIESINIINANNKSLLDSFCFEVAGWGNKDYVVSLKQMVADYNLNDVIHFRGALYSEDKERLLKDAFAFILPSYSEGLPMAVLEAWAYGLPVLITDDCNLPIGFETKAAYKIHTDPVKLSKELETFFMMKDEEVFKMGKRGHTLVQERFGWDVIANQMNQLYEWVLGNTDKPDFVKIE